MKYPFIGEYNGTIKLFYSSSEFHVINSSHGVNRHVSNYANVGRTLLEGWCVRVSSQVHGEFLRELALNSGFKETSPLAGNYMHFTMQGDFAVRASSLGGDVITIPMPPKAETEPKESVEVGDTVTWDCNTYKGRVMAIDGDNAWCMRDSGYYYTIKLDRIQKPKSEAEILRDELGECIKVHSSSEGLINDLVNKYNITKKPQ